VKSLIAVLALLTACVVAFGEAPPTKRLILSPKSNLDTATISEGFAKSCPNVMVTDNEAKADYVLEAINRPTYSDGDSYGHWHFTLLSKEGDVLMTTHPERHFKHRYQHHFESVCKYINSH
jgi:hypothetical protein